MPANPFPMTLPGGVALLGEPCAGALQEQRAALAHLLSAFGWPEIRRSAEGKPLLEKGHCSLSHGGGWVTAARGEAPVGIDVEAPGPRLEKVRRRFVGPEDHSVVHHFGDGLATLCRLWTAKEAVYKVFGSGVDFLSGIEWLDVHDHGATVRARAQDQRLELIWMHLTEPEAWVAVAFMEDPIPPARIQPA